MGYNKSEIGRHVELMSQYALCTETTAERTNITRYWQFFYLLIPKSMKLRSSNEIVRILQYVSKEKCDLKCKASNTPSVMDYFYILLILKSCKPFL